MVVDTDILKPDTGALSIERPQHTSSSKGSSGSERAGSSGDATPDLNKYPYTEPVSEGEEDEERDLAPGACFHSQDNLYLTNACERLPQRETKPK